MASLKKSDCIGILSGGVSQEKQISIQTAMQVSETLKQKYNVKLISVGNNYEKLLNDFKTIKPSLIFNCLHGSFGEDGQIQSILNYLKIPYTHSGVLASSIAMNKMISKYFFNSIKVDNPKASYLDELSIKQKINSPYIIKPINGGSSYNLFIIENKKKLKEFIFNNKNKIKDYMVEEFIPGREITVGILNNRICGIMEIVFNSNLYDFKNKYVDIAEHILNPKLPKTIIKQLKKISLDVHNRLNCNCISRLDFRYNEKNKKIFLLEINTQPGLTKNSLIPEMAKDNNIDFLELCEIILKSASCEKF